MSSEEHSFRRGNARERSRRDLERLRRRDPDGGFWASLALLGSVGWPIVLLALGGALFGRYLDGRFDTGLRFTLMLLSLGTVAGGWIAYRTLRGDGA